MNSHLRSVWPLLLAALTLIFFSGGLIFGGIFTFRDLLFFHYPLRHAWISELLRGHAPFLNAAINGGQPVLSNPNYAVFYPGNVLYLVLPFDAAWNLSLAGHALWAALGVYCLCRYLRCEKPAAFIAAVVFGFGGPLISCLTYYNLLITGSWIPWILLSALQLLDARSGRMHAGAYPMAYLKMVLLLAILLLAGEPTIVLITATLLCILWLIHRPANQLWSGHVRTGILIALPALMIAAIQWIPAISWLGNTTRGEGLDFRLAAAYWSFHPARMIEYLAPHFYGDITSSYQRDYWGGSLSDNGFPYVVMVYCGWLPWLLTGAAFQRRAGKAALLLCACSLLLSFGHRLPGYRSLFEFFPLYRVIRYPEKFQIFLQLGLSVAAGIGCNELLSGRCRKSPWITVTVLFIFLAAAALFLHSPGISPEQRAQQIHSLASGLIAGLAAIAALILITRPRWRAAGTIVLPLVLVADLLPVTYGLLSTTPREEIHRPPKILQPLDRSTIYHHGEDQENLYFNSRIQPELFMRESLYPFYGLNWNISYGSAGDVDRMLWQTGQKRAATIRRQFPSAASIEMMRRSGIGHVVSLTPLDTAGLKLESAIELAPGTKEFLYRIDPAPLPKVSWENGSGQVSWNDNQPDKIQIRSRSAGDGILNVLVNAIPGWHCKIDGSESAIQSTALGWIRVPVRAGDHTIQLSYRPPGLIPGAALAFFGIAFAVIISRKARKIPLSPGVNGADLHSGLPVL